MLSRRGYAIRLDSLSPDSLQDLKNKLMVTPETNSEYGVTTSYKVYQITKNFIIVPRNFFPYVKQTLPDGLSIDISFEGTLKDSTHQNEASDKVLEGLLQHGSGILSLPTGYGKTTVALHLLSKIKQKTLIVVHKEFLMTQWAERIQQFLPNARVGKLQANVIDTESKDIVIAMLQSLSKKEYEASVFDGFGLTIIDETHHVCTRSFSKMFTKINTKYLLGLSATLERKDGLTYVLHWFLGNLLYKVERTHQRQVNVRRIEYRCDHYKKPFPVNRARKPSLPEAITTITELAERNEFILEIIRECLAENRKILVLSDRRKHCVDLMNMLNGASVGLYIGGMKAEELKTSEQCDVILATYSLAHEGLDIPALDTLIMASPKSDIVQSVGRILRETIGKQNTPYVADVVDLWGPFQYQYYKRCKYYKSAGFSFNKGDKEDKEDKEYKLQGYAFQEECVENETKSL
jgi:superfamily II DNA or RNA helicase